MNYIITIQKREREKERERKRERDRDREIERETHTQGCLILGKGSALHVQVSQNYRH